MTRKLEVGDIVRCKLYNKPEGRFYGDTFVAEITKVGEGTGEVLIRDFKIKRLDGTKSELWVWRKEIKRRISL